MGCKQPGSDGCACGAGAGCNTGDSSAPGNQHRHNHADYNALSHRNCDAHAYADPYLNDNGHAANYHIYGFAHDNSDTNRYVHRLVYARADGYFEPSDSDKHAHRNGYHDADCDQHFLSCDYLGKRGCARRQHWHHRFCAGDNYFNQDGNQCVCNGHHL